MDKHHAKKDGTENRDAERLVPLCSHLLGVLSRQPMLKQAVECAASRLTISKFVTLQQPQQTRAGDESVSVRMNCS